MAWPQSLKLLEIHRLMLLLLDCALDLDPALDKKASANHASWHCVEMGRQDVSHKIDVSYLPEMCTDPI